MSLGGKGLISNHCAVGTSNFARDGQFAVKCTQTARINRLTSGWVIRNIGNLVVAPTARAPSFCLCSAEILICVLVRSCKEAVVRNDITADTNRGDRRSPIHQLTL